MSSSQTTAWPVDVDASSWQQTLASTAKERERIVASLRHELSLLEGLTSQTVAALSLLSCPPSLVGNGSPQSPVRSPMTWMHAPGASSPLRPHSPQRPYPLVRPPSIPPGVPPSVSNVGIGPSPVHAPQGRPQSVHSVQSLASPRRSASTPSLRSSLKPSTTSIPTPTEARANATASSCQPMRSKTKHEVLRAQTIRSNRTPLPAWPRSSPSNPSNPSLGPAEPVQTPPRPRPLVHL